MSFANKKHTPRTHTHFGEDEDVRYVDMLKAITPVKRPLFAGTKFKSNSRKASPYAIPPSNKPSAGRTSSSVAKENRLDRVLASREPNVASGSSLQSHTKSQPPLDGLELAVAQVPGAELEKRFCTRKSCYNIVPAYSRWKTCDLCRSKSKQQRQTIKTAKDEKIREVLMANRHSPAFKYEEELRIPEDWSHLSIEERFQSYMSQLRSIGKLRIKSIHAIDSDTSEYRTASDLYEAVERVVAPSQSSPQSHKSPESVELVNFRGYYQVVQGADLSITPQRVIQETRKAVEQSVLRVR